MKKIPWGIFASVAAQLTLYCTIGVVAAYAILEKIANQTNDTTTIFGTWWQTLIFVAGVLFAACAVFCLIMYVKKKKTTRGERNEIKENF